jgi:hypothetical protein
VESLFRIRDKDVKNSVLQNYQNLPETRDVTEAEGDVAQGELFADDAEPDEHAPPQFSVKQWTLQEDKLLI